MSLLDRYDALPVDFQSEPLLTAIQAHDDALAKHLDVQARLASARQAVEDARNGVVLGLDDTWNALLAAGMLLTACEMVAPRYPLPGTIHVDGAADTARAALAGAIGLPEAPKLLAELEERAWATSQIRNHRDAVRPIVLPADRLLIDRLDAWRRERLDLQRAIASWDTPQIQADSLMSIEHAVSLLRQASQHAATGDAIVEQVEAANVAREDGGYAWDDRPANIPNADTMAMSFEQKQLHRARELRRMARAVPV
jgi:hypothetical protein